MKSAPGLEGKKREGKKKTKRYWGVSPQAMRAGIKTVTPCNLHGEMWRRMQGSLVQKWQSGCTGLGVERLKS